MGFSNKVGPKSGTKKWDQSSFTCISNFTQHWHETSAAKQSKCWPPDLEEVGSILGGYTLFFPFWFPSDFYEIAAKSGTKWWDQKVGPNNVGPIISLSLKYFHFHLLFTECLDGGAHKMLASGARVGRIDSRSSLRSLSPHNLFRVSAPKKVATRSDILEDIPRLSWIFPLRKTVPPSYFKSGTNHHQPHHWIIVGFSWIIFAGSFSR